MSEDNKSNVYIEDFNNFCVIIGRWYLGEDVGGMELGEFQRDHWRDLTYMFSIARSMGVADKK